MELRTDPISHALVIIEGIPTSRRCQVNVGTASDPISCGEKLAKLDDWTDNCPKHGEMH